MPVTVVYTDGSSDPNPGDGGWSYCVINDDDTFKVSYGSDVNVTNNRMELYAILKAIRRVRKPCVIYSDSRYCVDTFNKWVHAWKRRGWKRVSGGPILNLDIIKDIHNNMAGVTLKWVKGHDSSLGNIIADFYAVKARTSLTKGKDVGNVKDFMSSLNDVKHNLLIKSVDEYLTTHNIDLSVNHISEIITIIQNENV